MNGTPLLPQEGFIIGEENNLRKLKELTTNVLEKLQSKEKTNEYYCIARDTYGKRF